MYRLDTNVLIVSFFAFVTETLPPLFSLLRAKMEEKAKHKYDLLCLQRKKSSAHIDGS